MWTGSIFRQGRLNVACRKCCSSKLEGALGIRSLRIHNSAFNTKLTWDILCKNSVATFYLHNRCFNKMIDLGILVGCLQFGLG